MSNHKTKLIELNGVRAEIDEKIADLILNLWKLRIKTTNSCQNNVPKNYVWIEFFTAEDAHRFVNIVADYSENISSVYQNMMSNWQGAKAQWIYDVNPIDFGVDLLIDEEEDVVSEEFDGEHKINFLFSIRFPVKHLKFVKAQIEAAAELAEQGMCPHCHSEACEEEIDPEFALKPPASNKNDKFNIN